MSGYTHEISHWDLISTAKKSTLAVISLFASAPLQLFFTIWVLLLFGGGLRHFQPYESIKHERMDEGSTVVLIFTVTVGMLFYTGVLAPEASDGFGVSIMLIIINFVAVVLFLFVSTNIHHIIKSTRLMLTETEMDVRNEQ